MDFVMETITVAKNLSTVYAWCLQPTMVIASYLNFMKNTQCGYMQVTHTCDASLFGSIRDNHGRISDFRMPPNRSYYVFLLEDGDDFSLVTQIFIKIQPTLTVSSDTLTYISTSIKKISSHNCKHTTARELSQCIMEKVLENITSLNLSCLPFQMYKMFPTLHTTYTECDNDEVAMNYTERVM